MALTATDINTGLIDPQTRAEAAMAFVGETSDGYSSADSETVDTMIEGIEQYGKVNGLSTDDQKLLDMLRQVRNPTTSLASLQGTDDEQGLLDRVNEHLQERGMTGKSLKQMSDIAHGKDIFRGPDLSKGTDIGDGSQVIDAKTRAMAALAIMDAGKDGLTEEELKELQKENGPIATLAESLDQAEEINGELSPEDAKLREMLNELSDPELELKEARGLLNDVKGHIEANGVMNTSVEEMREVVSPNRANRMAAMAMAFGAFKAGKEENGTEVESEKEEKTARDRDIAEIKQAAGENLNARGMASDDERTAVLDKLDQELEGMDSSQRTAMLSNIKGNTLAVQKYNESKGSVGANGPDENMRSMNASLDFTNSELMQDQTTSIEKQAERIVDDRQKVNSASAEGQISDSMSQSLQAAMGDRNVLNGMKAMLAQSGGISYGSTGAMSTNENAASTPADAIPQQQPGQFTRFS